MKILFLLACVALAVIVSQLLGHHLDPLMTRWWVFAPAHFTAGMFLGVFGAYIAHGMQYQRALMPVLMLVLVVGVAWEILEHMLFVDLLWYDTASDIVVDLLGGYAGYRLIGEHA